MPWRYSIMSFLTRSNPNSPSYSETVTKLSCKDIDSYAEKLIFHFCLSCQCNSKCIKHICCLEKSKMKWSLAPYLEESLCQNTAVIPWSPLFLSLRTTLNDRKGTLPFTRWFIWIILFTCSFIWFLKYYLLTTNYAPCVLPGTGVN